MNKLRLWKDYGETYEIELISGLITNVKEAKKINIKTELPPSNDIYGKLDSGSYTQKTEVLNVGC